MKTLSKPVLLFLPLLFWGAILQFQVTISPQVIFSPTPTSDPFVEPPLPPKPTEFELGRNLYWHWCMTCHGDHGQGLTDEFRSLWDVDHQNCWGRGCHVGRKEDQGFPIPTLVPAIVNDTHLGQFTSVEGLVNFLQATHPPQSPGILKYEEYHAIALFVFKINGRTLVNVLSTESPASFPTLISTPIPTQIQIPPQEPSHNPFPIYGILIFAALLVGMSVLVKHMYTRE